MATRKAKDRKDIVLSEIAYISRQIESLSKRRAHLVQMMRSPADGDQTHSPDEDDLPVSVLPGLNERTVGILLDNGIHTIGELKRRTETDLLRMPDLGRRALNEIRDALAERGETWASTR